MGQNWNNIMKKMEARDFTATVSQAIFDDIVSELEIRGLPKLVQHTENEWHFTYDEYYIKIIVV